MKKFIKKAWKPFLLIAIYVFAFWFLLKDIEISEMKQAFGQMNYLYLIIACVMVLGQIFVQGLCYVVMSRKYNLKMNSLQAFGYCSIDLFFSQITPFAVGGQPIMVYEMNKNDLPASKSTTMVLLYSFLNKIALIILAIFAIALYHNVVFTGEWYLIALFIFGICSNLIIASFSIGCMFLGKPFYKICAKIILFLNKKHLIRNPYGKIRKLRKSVKDFKESNKFLKNHLFLCFIVLLLCILKRIITFSIGYFIYVGLGLDEYGFIYLVLIQTILAVIADSFPIPGGIGAYELSFNAIYAAIYSETLVASALLMVRGISYYLLIVVSGISTLFMHLYTKNRAKKIAKKQELLE